MVLNASTFLYVCMDSTKIKTKTNKILKTTYQLIALNIFENSKKCITEPECKWEFGHVLGVRMQIVKSDLSLRERSKDISDFWNTFFYTPDMPI